ncbi:MAG: hypothetical protein K6T80_06050, partial [Firmicutes bacterium]|nr:hypothetical protein [Bacillota bacterium]
MKKTGYLGPEGTFSEEAARKYLGGTGGAVACGTLNELVEAVERGELDECILPLENSCEGSVNLALDLLAGSTPLKIRGEIILPVCQNLLVRPGTKIEEIAGIISHSQGLAQCREFIRRTFAGIRIVESSSTAEAARQVAAREERWGAIGTAAPPLAWDPSQVLVENPSQPWDSARLLVLILSLGALAAAGLMLLPRVLRRIVFSLLILVHFGGIFCAVMSVPPQPWLTTQAWI